MPIRFSEVSQFGVKLSQVGPNWSQAKPVSEKSLCQWKTKLGRTQDKGGQEGQDKGKIKELEPQENMKKCAG